MTEGLKNLYNITNSHTQPWWLGAEIVETTFVVSRFSIIRKEMTLFLVVPKKNDQERRSFSVRSDNTRPGTTRNDQWVAGSTHIVLWPMNVVLGKVCKENNSPTHRK